MDVQQRKHIMRVKIYVEQFVEMKRLAVQRLEKCKAENLCVACLESLQGEKKIVRGCHDRCHAATMRAIERGEFTEKERIQEGKLLEKKPGGAPRTNPVSVEAKIAE